MGVQLFGTCFRFRSTHSKRIYHQVLVLVLTFIAYTAFHMGRRPLSIVKNVLNRDCSKVHNRTATTTTTTTTTTTQAPYLPTWDLNFSLNERPVLHEVSSTPMKDTSCDWEPFNDDATANQLLAYLDTAFLLSYAIFMFFSGFIAERVNLRRFVAFGCVLSGLGLVAFGISHPLDIHSMTYFIAVQIVSGAAQTTGWPVVVTCVSNWFDRSKLGTIYGLWNSHTNLGNILGATIAGHYVEKDWGLSFMVPGAIMIGVGVVLFLFLVPAPKDVGLSGLPKELDAERSTREAPKATTGQFAHTSAQSFGLDLESSQRDGNQSQTDVRVGHERAISFFKALMIPGVIEYSFCLFFAKLVSYTFLYWLPRYITASTTNNSQDSAYLSASFDLGGIVGAIVAGYLSDKFKVNGIICNIMLMFAIPSMFAYQKFGALSSWNNILLQLLVGMLVNGPYCLITTAVSADLGDRIKDGHAMATVSAIIDGMGSLGAVVGPLFAGFVSTTDWSAVFIMLMLSDVFASLCIVRVTIMEVKELFNSE